MTLKLFWWKRSGGRPNFGDELGRLLVERLSRRRVEFADLASAELVAVGSLLAPHLARGVPWSRFRGCVWGTGCMYEGRPLRLPFAQVLALRGTLTRDTVACAWPEQLALGDPGLLAPLLVERAPRPRFDLGVVPHWTDWPNPVYQRGLFVSPGVRLIDPLRPVGEVLEEIAACRAIVASSLHGLVTADALGIPNVWGRAWPSLVPDAEMPAFKYRDYYSAFGIHPTQPVPLTESLTRNQLEPYFATYRRPGLESLRQGLLETFPFRR